MKIQSNDEMGTNGYNYLNELSSKSIENRVSVLSCYINT